MYLHFQSHIKLTANVFLLKNNETNLSGYCGKTAKWVEWLKLPMSEWRLSSRMLLKGLLKKFFKVQWTPILIPFKNGDNKTILKNLKQQFMSVIKLRPDICTTYIELSKNFGRRDRETGGKLKFPVLNYMKWSQFAIMLRQIWNPKISNSLHTIFRVEF